jgi:hypothetical protein
MRTLPALVAATVIGCSTGAPPAFPKGDRWTFPLVGTLEGGQLVVPVYVQNTGPYLMVIDPDSDASVIDDEIAKQIGALTGRAGDILDESDTIRHRYAAEVKSLTIGNLTVGRQFYYLMKAGGLQVAGRDIRGVIGRDIISDVLAFGYDRERGTGYLFTQSAFTPPAGATEIKYSLYDVIDQGATRTYTPPSATASAPDVHRGMGPCGTRAGCSSTNTGWTPDGTEDISGQRTLAMGRRIVKAQIGGVAADVHLDLGAPVSQLRRKLWAQAGLAEVAATFALRDEAGTIHRVTGGGIAEAVTIGGVGARKTAFAPYDDQRWDPQYIDGTVGLDALRGHNAWANWLEKRFYLVPRGDLLATTKDRIGRWQSQVFDRCADGGCARVKLLAPTAAAPAEPPADGAAPGVAPRTRVVLMIERDAATAKTPLELVLAPVTADGKLAAAPLLIVNLAADANDASTQLGPEYAGLDLRVVDASPYPRACPSGGGCIDSIAP